MACYPASYPGTTTWSSGNSVPVSCRLSAAGLRFLGILCPPGTSAPLTVGLPAPRTGPWRGCHVPHAWDAAGGGRPLYPGDGGVHTAANAPRPPPAASQRHRPCLPGIASWPGKLRWRGIIKDFRL